MHIGRPAESPTAPLRYFSTEINNSKLQQVLPYCLFIVMSKDRKRRTWADSYARLVKFKIEFGHCDVPRTYKADVTLGSWVNRARTNWDKLEPLQRTLLLDIGFSIQKQNKQMKFEEGIVALLQYQAKHGHVNVPSRSTEYNHLANWVRRQKHEAKLFQQGLSSTMMVEKYNLLVTIGLVEDATSEVDRKKDAGDEVQSNSLNLLALVSFLKHETKNKTYACNK
jgi:hypothetical protein